jgi:hypothetical protein
MSFEQGWIPQGWKRGEPLDVRPPPAGGWGVVSPDMYARGPSAMDVGVLNKARAAIEKARGLG